MRIDRVGVVARHAAARVGGWTSLLMFACGLAALAGALAVFGAATEDVTQHNGMARHDPAHLREVIGYRNAWLVHAAMVLTDVGAVVAVAAIAVLACALLLRRGLPRVVAIAPVVSFALAAGAVAVVKPIVGRTRPPAALHLVRERDASFPSGHATDSTAVFLTIALVVAVFVFRRPIVRVLMVAGAGVTAVFIGASRLLLGVHWPSDVVAGWALGTSVALTVTIAAALVARLAPTTGEPPSAAAITFPARARSWLAHARPRHQFHAA